MALKEAIQSFFSRSNPEASAPLLSDTEKLRELVSIMSISKDVPIEIKDGMSGAPLFTGCLNTISLNTLLVGRLPGVFTLPVLDYGQFVKIRGYSNALDPINIAAKVQDSNQIMCQLNYLRLIPSTSNRLTPRLPLINVEGQLFMDNDKWMARPTPCRVVDISVTAANVISEYCIPDEAPFGYGLNLSKDVGHLHSDVRLLEQECWRIILLSMAFCLLSWIRGNSGN